MVCCRGDDDLLIAYLRLLIDGDGARFVLLAVRVDVVPVDSGDAVAVLSTRRLAVRVDVVPIDPVLLLKHRRVWQAVRVDVVSVDPVDRVVVLSSRRMGRESVLVQVDAADLLYPENR